MDENLCEALSQACNECHLVGGCCFEARPPLSQERIDILLKNGVSADAVEFAGYKRLRLKPDGFCVLFQDGKCSIHSIKPETCVAGPFTFDMKGNTSCRYSSRERASAPWSDFLKANRKAYDGLFETSVEKIMDLVNKRARGRDGRDPEDRGA